MVTNRRPAKPLPRAAAQLGLIACLLLPPGCATHRTQPSFANDLLERPEPPETPSLSPVPIAFSGETGPTLTLDYGAAASPGNPIASFMYFVPLISPDPVTMQQSANNSQRARVLGLENDHGMNTFSVECGFEITGEGHQESTFNLEQSIQASQRRLNEGKALEQQLAYIRVEGGGRGTIRIRGIVTNATAQVTGLSLLFSDRDQRSPVTIGIHDLRRVDGIIRTENERVARVGTLTFERTPDQPRMAVTVDTINRKDARNNLWQRFKGNVTAAAANMLIQPIPIEAAGQEAMLNFGLALAARGSSFTFPKARSLHQTE